MSANDKLMAFLAADAAPARDFAFMAGVEERMARIRLFRQARRVSALSLAIAFILFGLVSAAGLTPVEAATGLLTDLAATPGLALAAGIVALALWLPRLLPSRFSS
jgi:hypothetical protein